MKNYIVMEIYDADYGCEGVPENEEPMCSVYVKDIETGELLWKKCPDSWLTEQNIQEGDTITLS